MKNNQSLLIMVYGIGRSTRYTYKSINSFISLSKQKFKSVSVVYNLLSQDKVVSRRTRENSLIDHSDRTLINFDQINILSSKDFDYSDTLGAMKKGVRDIYDDDFFTYENLLKQLSMIKNFENVSTRRFSHFCLIRDDATLTISNKFITKYFYMLQDNNSLITSSYYWNRGVCDRFLAGPISLLPLFINRIEKIQHMIKSDMIITGERLIKYILDSSKTRVNSLPIVIQRIRAGNVLAKERHFLPFWSLYDFFRVLRSMFGVKKTRC